MQYNSDIDIVPKTIGNTVQKRFRQAKVLTDRLADIVSNCTGAEFEKKMDFLRRITISMQQSPFETLPAEEELNCAR